MKLKLNEISKSSFKDFVFGFQDGLITTFVLLAGISVLVIFNPTILIVTLLAEIASGAISMAFGAYISSKTQNEIVKIKKIDKKTDNQEGIDLFDKSRLTDKEIEIVDNFFDKNPNLKSKLQVNQIKIDQDNEKDPVNNAILTGLAFIIGGFIPFAPYLIPTPFWSFILAVIFSFTGLFLIGVIRNKISQSKKHWIRPALEMVLLGILAIIIIEVYLYFISFFYGLIIVG
ncbi:MAG: hypothetical protein EU549_00880 [Promethearchaeota archaeon]|nr:MAG: hypothetical protein EU549_00880 [Candidatus Lokiarchaeota archaeon]